ncbi:hypothetical protein [Planomonospora venezuelensis]|uniref:Uncharacterized protein n=1 Tax=Planomonospora venezuelensis TaxID=1999 RepID=A0A841D348_PLAVE|nr:hypothetical protein [Planomonospora venezuelensis]MBB5965092.1 hypothetical protein [Planomonospora venezuelensis]GIN04990.1 hypothetical protein Pve01_66480 [Planomonospora venezuelensis]
MARRTLTHPATRKLLVATVTLWGTTIAVAIADIGNDRLHSTLENIALFFGIALVLARCTLSIQDHLAAVEDRVDGAVDGAVEELKKTLSFQQGVVAGARIAMASVLGLGGMRKRRPSSVPDDASELGQWRV